MNAGGVRHALTRAAAPPGCSVSRVRLDTEPIEARVCTGCYAPRDGRGRTGAHHSSVGFPSRNVEEQVRPVLEKSGLEAADVRQEKRGQAADL
eukprot:scaffold35081_cov45-Isochrysis_galbana.AAC.1